MKRIGYGYQNYLRRSRQETEKMLKKPNSQTLALNSLGLDTDDDALIIESDNVVFATSAAMSDTEDLHICFATTSLLDSLNDLSIDVLDIPVLDTDLFHLSRMVDQISEFVCCTSASVLINPLRINRP